MLIKSINDYQKDTLEYAIKLLKRNTPLSIIKKKTHLNYNEILYLVRLYNINYSLKNNLPSYTLDNNRIGIIADTHLGSTNENYHYLDLAYNYFIKHNIKNVIHCGDILQGPIDPITMTIQEQTKSLVKRYPKSKLVTTYLLCGNHDLHVFEDDEELFSEMFSRKDIKYLGTKESYIEWSNKLFLIQHFISKYNIDLPYVKPVVKFSGHHHFFKINKKYYDDIYVPSLSDDIKKEGESPAFLEALIENNTLYIEKKNVNKRVENVGLVYKKKM